MKNLLLSIILAVAILQFVCGKVCVYDFNCKVKGPTRRKHGMNIQYLKCVGASKKAHKTGICKWVTQVRKPVNDEVALDELDRENDDNFSGGAVLIGILSGFTAGAYGAWYFTKNKEYSRF